HDHVPVSILDVALRLEAEQDDVRPVRYVTTIADIVTIRDLRLRRDGELREDDAADLQDPDQFAHRPGHRLVLEALVLVLALRRELLEVVERDEVDLLLSDDTREVGQELLERPPIGRLAALTGSRV